MVGVIWNLLAICFPVCAVDREDLGMKLIRTCTNQRTHSDQSLCPVLCSPHQPQPVYMSVYTEIDTCPVYREIDTCPVYRDYAFRDISTMVRSHTTHNNIILYLCL